MVRVLKATSAALLLAMGLAAPVAAGPFEDGVAAYQRLDYAAAMRFVRPLAEKGSARAQVYVGSMYAHGQGVAQNVPEGMKWLQRATSQGDAYAQFQRGNLHKLGLVVPRDNAEALKWYRLAAAQGYAPALYNLGLMYQEGRGVPQDHAEAAKWYRLAIDSDFTEPDFNYRANAQLKLGRQYADGQGVPQDYLLAYMWLDLSAAQKTLGADIFRQEVSSRLTPAQLAEAKRLAQEWKPAAQPSK